MVKPPGTVRFLFLGDSILFGWRVTLEESLPEHYRAVIQHLQPEARVEMMNAGVIGHTSLQGALEIDRWMEFTPDYVFINYGWNDASTTSFSHRSDLHYHLESQRFPYRIGRLLNRSALLNFAVSGKPGDDDGQTEGTGRARVIPAEYADNLASIVATVRGRGGEAVFIPISVPAGYLAEMRKLAEEKNIVLMELDGVLQSHPREEMYLDACHPTASGYRLLAEMLYEETKLILNGEDRTMEIHSPSAL